MNVALSLFQRAAVGFEGKYFLKIGMRAWNHMHRHQFTQTLCSGCTGINHSMREPNAHMQWHKADFTYSGQVSAEASTTKILMIDWKRLFKKTSGTVEGGGRQAGSEGPGEARPGPGSRAGPARPGRGAGPARPACAPPAAGRPAHRAPRWRGPRWWRPTTSFSPKATPKADGARAPMCRRTCRA